MVWVFFSNFFCGWGVSSMKCFTEKLFVLCCISVHCGMFFWEKQGQRNASCTITEVVTFGRPIHRCGNSLIILDDWSPRNLCCTGELYPSYRRSWSTQEACSSSQRSQWSPWAQAIEHTQNCRFWFWTAALSMCLRMMMQLEDKSWMAVTGSELINCLVKKRRGKINRKPNVMFKLKQN